MSFRIEYIIVFGYYSNTVVRILKFHFIYHYDYLYPLSQNDDDYQRSQQKDEYRIMID